VLPKILLLSPFPQSIVISAACPSAVVQTNSSHTLLFCTSATVPSVAVRLPHVGARIVVVASSLSQIVHTQISALFTAVLGELSVMIPVKTICHHCPAFSVVPMKCQTIVDQFTVLLLGVCVLLTTPP